MLEQASTVELIVLGLNLIMAAVAIGGVSYSWLTGGVIRKAAEAVIMMEEVSKNIDDIHSWRGNVNTALVALAVTNNNVNELEVKKILDAGTEADNLVEDDQ